MLLIYLPAVTPRSEYVFDLIFKHELDIDYRVTTDNKVFEEYTHEKLNYSADRIGEDLFIRASSLLFEHSIEHKDVNVEKKDDLIILFANEAVCDIGFDVFSAVFYMVSRYEEYLSFNPDEHGRFKAADSLAYRNNFLQVPVVNTWINYFKYKLAAKFPTINFKSSTFRAIVTYDIDIAYAYKGRNFLRYAGGAARDILTLKFKNIINRARSIKSKDPWDVYHSLQSTIKKNNLNTVFFFLVGNNSKYDRNLKYDTALMKGLIKDVSSFSDIGIHPSYNSSVVAGKIPIEKERLEKISGKQITKSRQHYLRFNLPDTYNELLAAGITEDYSMGFADRPGFRAGICTPFYFYDLKKERSTDLKIFPVTFMEGTFLYSLKLPPKVSMYIILDLMSEVKKVGGVFIPIWHNDTISDDGMYKGWKLVHDEMIKKICELS